MKGYRSTSHLVEPSSEQTNNTRSKTAGQSLLFNKILLLHTPVHLFFQRLPVGLPCSPRPTPPPRQSHPYRSSSRHLTHSPTTQLQPKQCRALTHTPIPTATSGTVSALSNNAAPPTTTAPHAQIPPEETSGRVWCATSAPSATRKSALSVWLDV